MVTREEAEAVSKTQRFLAEVGAEPAQAPQKPAQQEPAPQTAPEEPGPASGDPAGIVAAIEALAGLHQRGILSDQEFAAKKTELLARL